MNSIFSDEYLAWSEKNNHSYEDFLEVELTKARAGTPFSHAQQATGQMLPGCSGCKHLMHDQTLDTYPCRGCIRVRRTDLFDAGSISPVA